MKLLKRLFIIIFSMTFLMSCKNSSGKDELYLSITATYYDDGVSPQNGMSILIYDYDLKKRAGNVIHEVPYTSQYPLAAYSKEDNAIYYSGVDDTLKCDQVWRYDIESETTEQITDNLFAINYIIPRKDDVVIIAVEKGNRIITPLIFDKKTKEVNKVDMGFDFTCEICTYNPITDTLLMSGVSETLSYDLRDKFNSRGIEEEDGYKYIPPDTYIYKLDGKNAELLLKLDNYQVINISSDLKGNIYYSGVTEIVTFVRTPSSHYKYLTDTKEIEEYKVIRNKYVKPSEDYLFISDNEIVFRGISNDDIYDANTYGIYLYNIETEEVKKLFDGAKQFDAYTNNFLILNE